MRLDAVVSRELMMTVFQVNTPLHDGAVIISDDRVVAARCVLPLSTTSDGRAARWAPATWRPWASPRRPTRWRLVVSEERGRVSVAVGGKLTQDLDAVALRKKLAELFQVRDTVLLLFWSGSARVLKFITQNWKLKLMSPGHSRVPVDIRGGPGKRAEVTPCACRWRSPTPARG